MNRINFWCLLVGSVAAFCATSPARAGLVDDVPSCYQANHIKPFATPYDHLIYVLVDQTVSLDKGLQRSALENINRLLVPGTKFVVAEFSAFSQGHYLQVLHTGIIERPIPKARQGDIVTTHLRAFKTCLQEQVAFARHMALLTTDQVMQASTSTLHQSDILNALKTVAPAIASDSAKWKTLFVVTDGLENSSVTSFYAHNTVRAISASAELKKAKAAGLIGDFGGAKVYVLGGAMMPAAASGTLAERDGYRDPKTLHDLYDFWNKYFQAANAKLVEFGEPALVDPLRY